jgi:putative ABC transport system ATP-binding protein
MISLSDIHKTYGDDGAKNHVLRGLNLKIERSEMVALTGASGSGKSTLLNIIGGLDQGYTGDVEVSGQRLRALSDKTLSHFRNRTVGFIFQQFHLLPHLPVVDNVLMPSWFARDAHAGRKDAIAVLERVGLAHKVDARPNHLSGGERQRVAIARALFNRPSVLLCDEPTGALDSVNSDKVFELIIDLNKQEGLTVVIVTHEREIAKRCPRQVHIVDGAVASDERGTEGGA